MCSVGTKPVFCLNVECRDKTLVLFQCGILGTRPMFCLNVECEDKTLVISQCGVWGQDSCSISMWSVGTKPMFYLNVNIRVNSGIMSQLNICLVTGNYTETLT